MKASDVLRDHQTQLDADGTMVGVSRQALCEVLDELSALQRLLVRSHSVLGHNFSSSDKTNLKRDIRAALLSSKEISDGYSTGQDRQGNA